jgi:hypothetical protein
VGRLRYVRSADHEHWHLLGFDRYELRAAGRRGALLRDRKTGFCLGDRYRIGGRRLPGQPLDPVLTGECGRDRPQLLRLRQGISVGYGDDYVPWLEGQRIDVTGLPPGRYRLVHRANPGGAIRETTLANNASSVVLRLEPRRRSVRVLAVCRDDAVCLP